MKKNTKYKVTYYSIKLALNSLFWPSGLSNKYIDNLSDYLNNEQSPANDGWRLVTIIPVFGLIFVWEKQI